MLAVNRSGSLVELYTKTPEREFFLLLFFTQEVRLWLRAMSRVILSRR